MDSTDHAGEQVFTALIHVAWVGVTAQTFGHIGNYYDLTVGNTGLLMGVGNTIATIPSALSPVRLPCVIILVALVLHGQDYSV